jgi:hypothetical protein
VHSARTSDVRTTIVDGRVLMRDRELLTIDVAAVVAEMGERMPALLDRSHGKRTRSTRPEIGSPPVEGGLAHQRPSSRRPRLIAQTG